MVHAFPFQDQYFLYDSVSGSLHKCDYSVYCAVRQRAGEQIGAELPQSELREAAGELDELTREGVLYAKEENHRLSCTPGEIKALCLHISHECNFRCQYCFAGGGNYHGESGHMPFEVAKNAIDFLIERSGRRRNLEVDFFGGEPLMNLDVVKRTVDYAKRRGADEGKAFKFTLTTNGLLLNEETSDWLNQEMDNVVLSIDGRPEVHNRVRKTVNGKDTYDLVVENFLRFRKIRGDKSYYVRGTFTALNLDFSKDVLYLNDLGFDQISVEPVVLSPEDPLAIRAEHLPRILAEYESLAGEYYARRKTDKWFNFFHFMIDVDGGPCLKKRLTGCGAGNEYLAVTPSGKIYPCHQFAECVDYQLGNVFERTLREEIRCTFAGSNLLTKPACADCFAKYHCSGGCSANSIHLCGDINSPYEISCAMMRKRTECALAVYALEKLDRMERCAV